MSSVAEKIIKIIAKADNTTNSTEADAFMARAHKMMREHGLTLLDLGRLDEDPVNVHCNAVTTDAAQTWARVLGTALSHYYGCNFVWDRVGNRIIYDVAGRESAIVTFTLMFPFVCKQVRLIGNKAWRSGKFETQGKAHKAIAHELTKRVMQLVPEQKKYEGTGVNALVPVDLIEQALLELGPLQESKEVVLEENVIAAELAKEVNIEVQVGTADESHQIGKS